MTDAVQRWRNTFVSSCSKSSRRVKSKNTPARAPAPAPAARSMRYTTVAVGARGKRHETASGASPIAAPPEDPGHTNGDKTLDGDRPAWHDHERRRGGGRGTNGRPRPGPPPPGPASPGARWCSVHVYPQAYKSVAVTRCIEKKVESQNSDGRDGTGAGRVTLRVTGRAGTNYQARTFGSRFPAHVRRPDLERFLGSRSVGVRLFRPWSRSRSGGRRGPGTQRGTGRLEIVSCMLWCVGSPYGARAKSKTKAEKPYHRCTN